MTLTKQFSLSEFYLEPVIMASNYVADNGRPLAELTAAPSTQKGVPFEMRQCPYEGSRQNKQMNISALPELSQGFQECLNDTAQLRLQYLAHYQLKEFNLFHFWKFTRSMSSLPAYSVRKRSSPQDEKKIPTRVSVLFKAAQGLHLAAEVMLLNGIHPDSKLSSIEIYNYIEDNNLFMDGDRACAGPKNKVIDFIESALEGAHGDTSDAWLTNYIQDVGNFLTYNNLVSDLFAHKALFEAQERLKSLELIPQLSGNERISKINSGFSRFGVFTNSDGTKLVKFIKNLKPYLNEEKSSLGSSLIDKKDILTLLDSAPNSQHEQICNCIVDDLPNISKWVKDMQHHQGKILKALDYSTVAPPIELTDIIGLGYTPFEIGLTAADLKVKKIDGITKLTSKSGLSTPLA